jgi:hypothetical protein
MSRKRYPADRAVDASFESICDFISGKATRRIRKKTELTKGNKKSKTKKALTHLK